MDTLRNCYFFYKSSVERLNTLNVQMACLVWVGNHSTYLQLFFRHPFKKCVYMNRKPLTPEVTRKKTTHISINP